MFVSPILNISALSHRIMKTTDTGFPQLRQNKIPRLFPITLKYFQAFREAIYNSNWKCWLHENSLLTYFTMTCLSSFFDWFQPPLDRSTLHAKINSLISKLQKMRRHKKNPRLFKVCKIPRQFQVCGNRVTCDSHETMHLSYHFNAEYFYCIYAMIWSIFCTSTICKSSICH